MRWSTVPLREAAVRIGLTGGGPGGFIGALAIAHNPWAAVAAVGVAISPMVANAIARIVESRNAHRPDIVRAEGDAQTALLEALGRMTTRHLEANSEADAYAQRTKLLTDLVRAGLESGQADQGAKTLVLLGINVDLPKGKPLNAESITKLLMALTKILTEETPTPWSPSEGPGSAPSREVVVPMRRQ